MLIVSNAAEISSDKRTLLDPDSMLVLIVDDSEHRRRSRSASIADSSDADFLLILFFVMWIGARRFKSAVTSLFI